MSRQVDPETSGDLADAARDLGAQPDVQSTLDAAVRIARERIKGCDAAGITVIRQGRAMSIAATDQIVQRGDALQYELREGPCLQAIVEHTTVSSPDLSVEERWPRWAATAARQLDMASMLSFQLFTSESTLGALNLYGHTPHAFDDDDQTEGYVLAGQVAVALVAAREEETMRSAIASRTMIGQAQGILMERLDIDADAAFGYLRRVSQDTNTKLVRVATDLVSTRHLPQGDQQDSAVEESEGTGV